MIDSIDQKMIDFFPDYEIENLDERKKNITLIKNLREHFEQEHGINYSEVVIIQMITNKGYSKELILKE